MSEEDKSGYGELIRNIDGNLTYQGSIPNYEGEVFLIPRNMLNDMIVHSYTLYAQQMGMDESFFSPDEAEPDEDGIVEIFPDEISLILKDGNKIKKVDYNLDRKFYVPNREELWVRFQTTKAGIRDTESDLENLTEDIE